MILVKNDVDFKLNSIISDDQGRYIIIDAEIQGSSFLFVNIYAPNSVQDQCCFYENLNNITETRPLKSVARENANKLEMTHRACVTKERPVNFTVNQVIPCVGRFHQHCSCSDCYLSKNNRR